MLGAAWDSGERKERERRVVVSFMAMVLGAKRVDCWGSGFAIGPGPWGKKREMDGWVMGGTCQKFVNNMRDWRVGWNVCKLAHLRNAM